MRDQNEEAKLLEEAAILCQRVYGESSGAFARLVFERFKKGAEEYGESRFLTVDCLVEALEEPADAAAWGMLDLQRVSPGLGESERAELRQFTLGVLAAAINLDAAIRRLRATRDDLLN